MINFRFRKLLSGIDIIPSAWDGFTATRLFRGAKYNITIKNPSHVCKGVKSMIVDGAAVEGSVVPYVEGKKEVTVEITLD